MNGYYYLHVDGSLFFKRFMLVEDSDFVKKVWTFDTGEREHAWTIVIEALALGARLERIKELSKYWGLTVWDLESYVLRVWPTPLRKEGMDLFIRKVLERNPDEFWDELREKKVEGEEANHGRSGEV